MKIYWFLASISFLIACNYSRVRNKHHSKEAAEFQERPWMKNEILSWKNDTLKCVFYLDTVEAIGPLKYVNLHYSDGKTYYGEHVIQKKNETRTQYLSRLKKAEEVFNSQCWDCGDQESFDMAQQNFEIITLYSLIEQGKINQARNYLLEREKKWKLKPYHCDLVLAILLDERPSAEIKEHVNDIPNLNSKDSIIIDSLTFVWQPIGERDYIRYKGEINWRHYFETALKRIEKGI